MSDLKRLYAAPTEEAALNKGFNRQEWGRSIYNCKFTLKKVIRQESIKSALPLNNYL